MSEINDDKKIAEKRKNLKGGQKMEVSLRDQIVRTLFNQLQDMEIGEKVKRLWNGYNSDRQEWLDRQSEYLADWDEFIEVEPQGVFESSSNLHVPVTLWVTKSTHSKYFRTLLTPEPALGIKARKALYADLAPDLEEFLKYSLTDWCNYNRGVDEAVDQFVNSWICTGIGVLKARWDRKFTKFVDVEQEIVDGPDEYVINPLTGDEVPIPRREVKENLVTKIEKTFDGPILENVDIEDIAIIGQDITDPNNADAVIQRLYLTASEMWTYVESGIFDKCGVEKVIEGGADSEGGAVASEIKMARQANSGDNVIDRDYDLDRYEVLEAYLHMDIDGTGINSDVVVWVHPKSGELLRATYNRTIDKTGDRPFFVSIFHKRSGTNKHLPIGIPEMIHGIAKEIDAIHNMRVDFGLISTVPFGFYRASSSMDAKELSLEPGAMYPLDNPQADVYFPNLGNRTSWGLQEERELMMMIERITTTSDMSLGIVSSTQGPTRTAVGSRAIQQEMAANMNTPLARLNRGWKKCLEYIFHMLQQRTPPGFEFRVLGKNDIEEYRYIAGPEMLAGDYDVVINPDSASVNKQIQIQNATELLHITQNPLDIQLGIVTPQNRYEAIKNYLKALGIKETSRFCNGAMEGQVLLSPKEELERLSQGIDVPVLPNSDHEGFIAAAQEFMSNFPEAASGEIFIIIQTQVQKHMEMQEAMQKMESQQQNMQQMQMNRQLANMENRGLLE